MDTKEILKKVRKIEIKTKRLSNNIFGGEYHSSFKGRGMTFSEVRQYQFGDDVRTIDWNVTARYNEPYVKVFEEERELTMMLMVDVSGSEFFGTTNQFKKDTVTEISATLAFSATQNNDKVGLILFSDVIELYIPPKKGKSHVLRIIRELIELYIPPKKGKSHVLRIIRELIEFQPKSKQTNISEALKFLSNVMKKRAIVFMLSDFMDENYERTLKIAGSKHDITGIRVYDRFDEEIPNLGLVPIVDAETGNVQLVNTSSKNIRRNYKANALRITDYYQNTFKRSGAGTISTRVDEGYVKKLLGYFKQKGR